MEYTYFKDQFSEVHLVLFKENGWYSFFQSLLILKIKKSRPRFGDVERPIFRLKKFWLSFDIEFSEKLEQWNLHSVDCVK